MTPSEFFDRLVAEDNVRFGAIEANCEECGAPCPAEYARCASCDALDWGDKNPANEGA